MKKLTQIVKEILGELGTDASVTYRDPKELDKYPIKIGDKFKYTRYIDNNHNEIWDIRVDDIVNSRGDDKVAFSGKNSSGKDVVGYRDLDSFLKQINESKHECHCGGSCCSTKKKLNENQELSHDSGRVLQLIKNNNSGKEINPKDLDRSGIIWALRKLGYNDGTLMDMKAHMIYDEFQKELKEEQKKPIVKASGILCIAEDTKKILVTKRAPNIPEPNTWCPPGGKYEDSDGNLKQTAIREFQEETGYKGSMPLKHIHTHKSDGLLFENYIGKVSSEFTPKLDKSENTDYKWLTLQELKVLPNKHFGLTELLNRFKTEDMKKLSEIAEEIIKEEFRTINRSDNGIDFDFKSIPPGYRRAKASELEVGTKVYHPKYESFTDEDGNFTVDLAKGKFDEDEIAQVINVEFGPYKEKRTKYILKNFPIKDKFNASDLYLKK